MPKKRVSLADLAKELDTTPATVSRGLRNDPRISAAMKEKIQALALARGYRPDPETSRLMAHIRSTRDRQTDSVLAILSDARHPEELAEDPYTRKVIEGARARAEALGFRMEILRLREPGMTQSRLETILYTRAIHGVLIPPQADLPHDIVLPEHHVAVVAATAARAHLHLHRVFPDHFANICTLLDQLAAQGRTRIGLVSTPDMEERQRNAPLAAMQWFAARSVGVKIVPPMIIGQSGGSVRDWFLKHKPNALLGPDAWVVDEIRDVAGGYDQTAVALFGNLRDGFAGIDEQPGVIGSAAVDLLSSQIVRHETGIPRHPKSVMIAGAFHPGLSLPIR
ncbi:MAG: LacI family DNA-binding transcriptional regulator [Verrucomicrobia bacterium]|nr:LacI family DNA-binding transcriptional regulator [Verrucomicrobiota bacterium]MCH8527530.1 LacI family DNA-binding transcriptional regulator [Kiritimatiellia bacterium]